MPKYKKSRRGNKKAEYTLGSRRGDSKMSIHDSTVPNVCMAKYIESADAIFNSV